MKILTALILLLPAAALAAPQLQAQSRAWAAFSYEEPASTTCYMVAASQRNATGARQAFAYITHRPTEQTEFVFKYDAGTALQAGGTAQLQIDQQKFDLFSNGTSAWADSAEDRTISRAMARGKTMRITATSAAGQKITDAFSLAGSAAALQAINKMCGIKTQ